MRKVLVGVVLVLMSLMSFVSCEKESSSSEGGNSIVGRWVDEEGDEYFFNEDGSFELYSPNFREVYMVGSWRSSGDKVIVDAYENEDHSEQYRFTITNITANSMTICYDGEEVECRRYQKK